MDTGNRSPDNITLHMAQKELVQQANGDCSSSASSRWHFFGRRLPRSEIVFFVQVTLVFIVAIVSLVNITLNHPYSQLWIALLSSSVGYLLPSPNLNAN